MKTNQQRYWGADEEPTPTIYEKLFMSIVVMLFILLMSFVLGSCNKVVVYPPAYNNPSHQNSPQLAEPVRKSKSKKVKSKFTITF